MMRDGVEKAEEAKLRQVLFTLLGFSAIPLAFVGWSWQTALVRQKLINLKREENQTE
jgi:hypothetical protein